MKNNIPFAIIGGLVAAVIGGVIWAAVTVATKYQIGWMAVGVGFLVGYAVRTFGKGETATFNTIGAICALLGCVLGNLLSTLGFVANEYGLGYIETLLKFDYSATFDVLSETTQPMDFLFYAIAVYEGFKFSTVEHVETFPDVDTPT